MVSCTSAFAHPLIKFYFEICELKESINKQSCVNKIGTFKNEDTMHSRNFVRYRPTQGTTSFQKLFYRFASLHWMWGLLKKRSEDIGKRERGSAAICSVQETRLTG